MAQQVSLVENIRPVARDQVKIRDRVLRATATGGQVTANGNSTVLLWDMSAYAAFAITLVGDSSSFSIDGSNDLISWFTVDAQVLGVNNAPVAVGQFSMENQASVGSIATTTLAGNKQARFMRLRAVAVSASRNASISAVLSQTPFTPTRPTKHLSPDNAWAYVPAAGGIVNTTAVTVRAATNSFHRSLVVQMQLSNGGTTGTEVVITDSVGPAVLWRGWLGPGASTHIPFDPPLRASPAGALTVTLSAASGAAVYANLQGLTALA